MTEIQLEFARSQQEELQRQAAYYMAGLAMLTDDQMRQCYERQLDVELTPGPWWWWDLKVET